MIFFPSLPYPSAILRLLSVLCVLSTVLHCSNGVAQETATGPVAEVPASLRGFRFSTKSAPEGDAAKPPAPEKGSEAAQELMQVGKATDIESLPPELMEMARKGALEVADRNWEEAKKTYLEMVKAAPENALAYANLGVAEHQLGNLLAASGNLGKSLELSPHIARNWQTLGLINYERGELALAISNLTRAIHEAPEDAESRLILAAVVRDYGWTDAAVTELQRAVELNPKLTAAHYNLAITYIGMKPPRIELARRHYFAAIDLGMPPSPEIEGFFKKSP